ncbi:MAG TPA: hypothetical protein VEX18_20325 [Polyangiaceae bacterium]|nr:hypothetical protein [Polyangiaceae bacterium]
MQAFRGSLATLALLLGATRSAASETSLPLPTRITYMGELGCRTSAEFRESVRRHAPELRDAVEHEPAREFVLAVTVNDDGSTLGSVDISEPSGASVMRRLNGHSCGEVADAMAFIVAELGMAARLEREGTDDERGDRQGTREAGAAPASPPAPSQPAPPERVAASSVPRSQPRLRWLRYQAGGGVDAVHGPVPGWTWGPVAYFEVGWKPSGVGALAAARLSLSRTASKTVNGKIGDAVFHWFTGRAEGCLPWLGTESFVATPCVTFDVGWLEAKASRADNPRTKRTVWLSPGLSVRASYAPLRMLVIEAEGGLMVPLSRPRFFFADVESDSETIYDVKTVGFRAGLRAGVLFP